MLRGARKDLVIFLMKDIQLFINSLILWVSDPLINRFYKNKIRKTNANGKQLNVEIWSKNIPKPLSLFLSRIIFSNPTQLLFSSLISNRILRLVHHCLCYLSQCFLEEQSNLCSIYVLKSLPVSLSKQVHMQQSNAISVDLISKGGHQYSRDK